jgi:O-antigen ligase
MIGLMGWMLTGQRGLLIVLILFILYLLFTKSKSLLWTNKKPLIFISTFLIIFSFTSPLFDRISNSIDSTYNFIVYDSSHDWKEKDSIVPRISIWKASVNIISENSFYGIGLDNFNENLENQILNKKINPIRDSAFNKSAGMNHAHNQYLDVYVKTGIFGLITLLIFIYGNIKYFKNGLNLDKSEDNLISLIGLLSVYTFSIIMLFQTFLAHQQLTLFMCLMLIIISSIKSNLNDRRNRI